MPEIPKKPIQKVPAPAPAPVPAAEKYEYAYEEYEKYETYESIEEFEGVQESEEIEAYEEPEEPETYREIQEQEYELEAEEKEGRRDRLFPLIEFILWKDSIYSHFSSYQGFITESLSKKLLVLQPQSILEKELMPY